MPAVLYQWTSVSDVMWVPVGNKLRGSVTLKLHFLALEIDKSINLIEEKALEMQGDEHSPWISACSC